MECFKGGRHELSFHWHSIIQPEFVYIGIQVVKLVFCGWYVQFFWLSITVWSSTWFIPGESIVLDLLEAAHKFRQKETWMKSKWKWKQKQTTEEKQNNKKEQGVVLNNYIYVDIGLKTTFTTGILGSTRNDSLLYQ